ncbi:MAG: HAD family hydrolase [Micrococcaceae bacterium]
MSVLRAVGFDLDGTLFDHRGAAEVAVNNFVDGLGVEPSEKTRRTWLSVENEQFERWRAGQFSFKEQRRERLRQVLPALGLDAPHEPSDLDDLFDVYLRAYREAWRPFADSVSLVRDLRFRGYRVGILTNGTEEQQTDKLNMIGLDEHIDVVCTSERIGVQKPQPQAFSILASELGVATDECLFVGDSAEQDVSGAMASGMNALLIDRYGAHVDGIASTLMGAITGDG